MVTFQDETNSTNWSHSINQLNINWLSKYNPLCPSPQSRAKRAQNI